MDATGQKTGFVFSAALFPYLYFFYRKMWLQGALALLLELVLNIPAKLLMLKQAGFLMFLPISLSSLSSISLASSLALGVLQIVIWGLFGAWFYRRTCAKRIRKLQQIAADKEEYHILLRKKGGFSRTLLVIVVALYLINTAAMIFMGGTL
ncbi:hypothetical protein SDC9_122444 [bioreactor metagenome]|uniref:Uncharacterized protein n=1 Tax=bioreactor metagenome TaxID=1076179 RepID=A0A645CEU3_9ZZZZ